MSTCKTVKAILVILVIIGMHCYIANAQSIHLGEDVRPIYQELKLELCANIEEDKSVLVVLSKLKNTWFEGIEAHLVETILAIPAIKNDQYLQLNTFKALLEVFPAPSTIIAVINTIIYHPPDYMGERLDFYVNRLEREYPKETTFINFAWGLYYFHEGRFEEAVETILKAGPPKESTFTKISILYTSGNAMKQTSQFEKAVKYFETALWLQKYLAESERKKLDILYVDSIFNYAYSLQQTEDYWEAARQYERLIKLQTKNSDAIFNLAIIYITKIHNMRNAWPVVQMMEDIDTERFNYLMDAYNEYFYGKKAISKK